MLPELSERAATRRKRTCRPRYATPRTARPTYGTEATRVALRMGWQLMPWQRQVLMTALEHDRAGQMAYRTVVVTVPRQCGKTLMLWVLMIWRALAWSRQEIIATAQTGQEASDKWRDLAVELEGSDLADQLHSIRWANGTEAIRWVNGSRHRVRPPTAKAGHGVTLDLGVVDEAWSLHDEVVVQSMRPAMVTKTNAQLWVVSTAGTLESALLRRHVELGRAAVTDAKTHSVAYFEWAAPDDLPADDPATWRLAMPALGWTITEEVVADERETMPPAEFDRAYLNRWTQSVVTAIPPGAWTIVQDTDAAPGEPVWLALDVTPERDASSIVAAGWCRGRVAVELIDHREGTYWLVGRVRELVARHKVAGVVLDGSGPAAGLAGDLDEVPTVFTYRDLQHASAAFYDAIVDGTIAVRPSLALDTAVRGAVKLGGGDVWRWGRRRASVDVSPLIAATVAFWKVRGERYVDLRIR